MSDWDTVTVLRKKAPKGSAAKSETVVNHARRQGVPVETTQKCELIRYNDTSLVSLWHSFLN